MACSHKERLSGAKPVPARPQVNPCPTSKPSPPGFNSVAGWKEVDPRPATSRSFGEVWETWFLNYPTVTLLLIATIFIYACCLVWPIFLLLK